MGHLHISVAKLVSPETNASARIVAPASEEDDYLPSVEQLGREDSYSRKSYAVNNEPAISTVEDGVSEVGLEVILRVVHITQILNNMKRSSPGELGIQYDTLLRYDWQMLLLWARGPMMEKPRVSHV